LPTAAQHLKKAAMKSGRYVFLCGHFYGVKIRFSPFPPLGNRAKNKEAKPKSFKLLLLASEDYWRNFIVFVIKHSKVILFY
jgi:hypothetical protein